MTLINRREFIRESAAIAGGLASAAAGAPLQPAPEFRSRWEETFDRAWPGPEYWTNPLQDWRIADGRLECVNAAPDRNIHLLTRQLGEKPGDLRMSVRVGRVEKGTIAGGKGSAGFRLGIQGPLREYRNSAIYGRGLEAGLTAAGGLFIGSAESPDAKADLDAEAVELRLEASPEDGTYRVSLAAHDAATGQLLGQAVYTLRIAGRSFQPFVFAAGKYTVRVSEPESGRSKEFAGVEAVQGNAQTMEVKL